MGWTITSSPDWPGRRTSHFYFHCQTIFYWEHPYASSVACIYRWQHESLRCCSLHCNGSSASFVISEARIALFKKLTLPKLELMGALTRAGLSYFISQALDKPASIAHLWSDSHTFLNQLQSEKRLHQFVSHWVTEIYQLIPTATCMKVLSYWRKSCRFIN